MQKIIKNNNNNENKTIKNLSNKSLSENINMPSKIANESIFKCSLNETTDKLDLSFWDLPEAVIIKYNKIGIKRMFEWQAQCLMSGSALSIFKLIKENRTKNYF